MFDRIRNERSDSNTIEFLIMILLIFGIFLMFSDFGLYFLNRNIITNAAQNGARLAAVYGGTSGTSIEQEYGTETNCSESDSAVGCTVINELKETGLGKSAKVSEVTCGPGKTKKIGERTYCSITWKFKGFTDLLDKPQTTIASSESEVIFRD
jgi:hypothetical protein